MCLVLVSGRLLLLLLLLQPLAALAQVRQPAAPLGLRLLRTPASAASHYVALEGRDTNPGTRAAPWRTVQHAVRTAPPGSTIRVGPGRYEERVLMQRPGLTVEGAGPDATIIDGSEPTRGWHPAADMGPGVWQTDLGYPVGALMADGNTIWKISDEVMAGKDWGEGDGRTNLTRPADATVQSYGRTVPFWDGIEALFGRRDRTVYLRFRDGDDPATRRVRASPDSATVTVDGTQHVTLRRLAIVGGRYAVALTGQAQGTTLDMLTLANGQWRVYIERASKTIIRGSTITMRGLGFVRFPGGAQSLTSTYRHQYDLCKFVIGDTGTLDANIALMGEARETLIEGNDLGHAMVGIDIGGSHVSGLRILANTVHNHSDHGIFSGGDDVSYEVGHNLFTNNAHHVRMNSLGGLREAYIYANRFFNPKVESQAVPKGIIPNLTAGTNPARLWIYHNSFAGGGSSCDTGGDSSGSFQDAHCVNNIFSTDQSNTGAGMDANNNLETSIWNTNTLPDFQPPPEAIDRASPLPALPGLTPEYVGDGHPDIGAIQRGGWGGPHDQRQVAH